METEQTGLPCIIDVVPDRKGEPITHRLSYCLEMLHIHLSLSQTDWKHISGKIRRKVRMLEKARTKLRS